MDDEVIGGWVIDPEVRDALRLDKAQVAYDHGELHLAVIEAEELLEDSPDHGEALLLVAEATLELGDAQGAAIVFEHALEHLAATGEILSGLALARYESCDLHGAITAAREAIRLSPDLAEAHYTLALALERIPKRTTEAAAALAAAHRLDPSSYPLPLELPAGEWKRLHAEALRRVPEPVRALWEGVRVNWLALPDLGELREAQPPITPSTRGLYLGEPPLPQDAPGRPEALRLFTRNLARLGDPDAIVEAIAHVLEDEAADWLDPDAFEEPAEG